jgi:hypothetical protein
MSFPDWNPTWCLMNMTEYALELYDPVLSTSHGHKDVIMVIILDLHVYPCRDWTRLLAYVTILGNVQVEWTVPML